MSAEPIKGLYKCQAEWTEIFTELKIKSWKLCLPINTEKTYIYNRTRINQSDQKLTVEDDIIKVVNNFT